jgi:hypothetical protein
MGNLLVQAQAAGQVDPGLDALRAVAARSASLTTYTPGARSR